MNICLRVPDHDRIVQRRRAVPSLSHTHTHTHTWTSSVTYITPAIRDVYAQYKEREHNYRGVPYSDGEYIVYRIDNDPYMPTYIAKMSDVTRIVIANNLPVLHNGTVVISQEIHNELETADLTMPILDIDDIRVFVMTNDRTQFDWLPARSYQIWAYCDFMYDPLHAIRKSYMSRGTDVTEYEDDDRILANQIVTIDVANIMPNIVFNITRNENRSVCIERNDGLIGTSIQICDNEYARARYIRFYARLTMDPVWGSIFEATAALRSTVPTTAENTLSTAHLSPLEETNDTDSQCILCVHYRVNTRFSPCEHHVCCSSCYLQLSKKECPICRASITQIMNV